MDPYHANILSRIDAVACRILVNTLHKGDPDGFRHGFRVATITFALAQELPEQTVPSQAAWLGGFFHDIGKLAVPTEILTATEPLTSQQRAFVEKHTVFGKFLVERLFESKDLIDAVLYHHERWDGKGYPRGLYGEQIPPIARLVALVDTYDAVRQAGWLLSHKSHSEVVDVIIDGGGKQFDPDLVKLFLEHEGRIETSYDRMETPSVSDVLDMI